MRDLVLMSDERAQYVVVVKGPIHYADFKNLNILTLTVVVSFACA